MAKVVLVILVIAVLGVGLVAYRMFSQHQLANSTQPLVTTQKINTLPVKTPISGLASKTDNSDQALDQDFANIQGSLNKLDHDQTAAKADSSSQDNPPTQ